MALRGSFAVLVRVERSKGQQGSPGARSVGPAWSPVLTGETGSQIGTVSAPFRPLIGFYFAWREQEPMTWLLFHGVKVTANFAAREARFGRFLAARCTPWSRRPSEGIWVGELAAPWPLLPRGETDAKVEFVARPPPNRPLLGLYFHGVEQMRRSSSPGYAPRGPALFAAPAKRD
jgi:hypothetical protein